MSTLIVGSLNAARTDIYQNLITSLNDSSVVKLMYDRILEGGYILEDNAYKAVHLSLTPEDYQVINLESLLLPLFKSLSSDGRLHIHNITDNEKSSIQSQLILTGFSNSELASDTLTASKPSFAPTAAVNITRKPKSAKKNLWNFSTAPPIDPASLLTEEDKAAPATPLSCPTTKKRRACADCSCGLREQLAQESQVNIDTSADLPKAFTNVQEAQAKGATSSCGSCYLGDAFRCASCPYLGLPAFEPGQKVEIDMSADL
ncbi:DUF689-domain-containing protein [Wallemia mellicola]|uniref:DUF689-domain-containing protein n=1 Tax=Wallemia mellicola TaxID=1708541 RepID=A0AB74KCH4_9BASI|nr:DUF689-domain-containing protein [Wallemia mellicola]